MGTFLTDLTMIDTAIPDSHPNGLINFDKRRKEFEVLAQIKLLQGAANAYHIGTDGRFASWFESVLLLDEREAFDLSCKLEPGNAGGIQSSSGGGIASKDKPAKPGKYHRKNDSIASTASSSCSESQFYFDTESSPLKTTSSQALEDPLEGGCSNDEVDNACLNVTDDPSSPFGGRDSVGGSGRWSSAPSSSAATSNNGASVDSCSQIVSSEPKPLNKSSTKSDYSDNQTSRPPSKSGSSSSKSMTKPSADSPYRTSEFYIIRVSIMTGGPETEGVIMYKSIMIGNHERTREVIRNAMMKHGLEGSPDNYTLAQVLPDKGT